MRKDLCLLIMLLLFTSGGVVSTFSTGDAPRHYALELGPWSKPVNLGPEVNSEYGDVSGALSNDGLRLYFSSTRPGGLGGEDIWVSERSNEEGAWGRPVNLGPAVNTPANERIRSISPDDRTILYQSEKSGGFGGNDIWASRLIVENRESSWAPAENLGPVINTQANELGSNLIFTEEARSLEIYFASNRSGGFGGADIYLSSVAADDFGVPANLAVLNTPFNETCMALTRDGLEIIFSSTRPDPANALDSYDLWSSKRKSVFHEWEAPVNLGETVNREHSLDVGPTFSADGTKMIFTSNRPGGIGDRDLYITTREMLAK